MAINTDEAYVSSLNVSSLSGSGARFKRKTLKACDPCRRRKVRCGGNGTPERRCSNCTTNKIDCTYKIPFNVQKRGSKAHIEDLEIRVANAEKLLNLLSPQIDIPHALKQIDKEDTTRPDMMKLSLFRFCPNTQRPEGDLDSSEDERHSHTRTLAVGENSMFVGKSSGIKLVRFAIDSKNNADMAFPKIVTQNVKMRSEYWDIQSWMKPPKETRRVECNFPDPDLLSSLVELYFTYINPYIPLLHRPTLEKAIADGLHQREVQFAATVLLICAIGVRFSEDPRVTAVPYDHPKSLGWVWFYQSQEMHQSVLFKPSLHTIQAYCLSAMFMEGCSPDHARWTMLGAGIRLAQEVGAHTRRKYGSNPTVESELWKRAFWTLVVLDRVSSATLGRICAVQEEDFDLDLPIQCDDEYWLNEDEPENAFKQPVGVPSQVSYFVWNIKLSNFLAMTIRKICAIEKFKDHSNKDWDKPGVDRMNAGLKRWNDSLPEHLRWDPNRKNLLFYRQSASLRSGYYITQLVAHQPFLGSRKFPLLAASSLTICSGAARACVQLINASRERLGMTIRAFLRGIFSCAVHLLQIIWSEKKDPDESVEMKEVYTCMDILSGMEERWSAAGRLRDIIYALITSSEVSDKYTSLLDVNVHIPPMLTTPQDQLRVHSQARRERALWNDMTDWFPSTSTSLTVQVMPPPLTCKARDKKPKTTSPQLVGGSVTKTTSKDSYITELDMDSPVSTIAASFWMGSEHDLSIPTPVDPGMTLQGIGFDSTQFGLSGEFDIWSTAPSGNELGDWDSYLHNMRQMVKGIQDSTW